VTAGRIPRRPAGRRNRRHGPPLWARLPSPRLIGRGIGRGLRAALPAFAVVGGLAALAGAAHLGYRWVTGSERFAVADIQISGNQTVTSERIRELLGPVEGENIFALDLPALEDQIEGDPWIAGAVVERRLPDRLEIEVSERSAAALVELGGLYLADAEGHPFKRADVAAGEGAGLPLITGLRRDDFRRLPDAVAARVREGLDLLALYGARADRPAVGEVHYDPRTGTVLRTRDTALAIRLGHLDGDQAAVRLAAFDTTWTALHEDERRTVRVVYLDNRTRPDRVTVRFDAATEKVN
jgi:cell division septal protein FtsQ